jgi:hypothetical protein
LSYIQYEMKYEIIYTEDCALIVSDEEIKPGDFNVPSDCNKSSDISRTSEEDLVVVNDKFNGYKKIIGHRPFTNAAILEGVPMLPQFSKEKSVVSIAEEILLSHPDFKAEGFSEYQNGRFNGIIDGFNKAKETYKFTEEDLETAMLKISEYLLESIENNKVPNSGEKVDEIIQSLQQPKLPKYFQIEMLCYVNPEFNEYPKTITNSEGQTELIGKYL